MSARTVLAITLAIAFLLPPAGVLSAPESPLAAAAEAPTGGPITGPLQILPYPTAGAPSLLSLQAQLRQDLGLPSVPVEPLPSALLGSTGPQTQYIRWLHDNAFPLDAVPLSRILGGVGVSGISISGTVNIDTDMVVDGTSVTFDGATLIFSVPAQGHRTISVTPTGTLTIKNSLVKNADGDRLHYGLISALGGLQLDNDRFEQMVVDSVHSRNDAVGDQPAQLIQNSYFTNTPYGVFTDRNNVTIQKNTFYLNEVGIEVVDASVNDGCVTYCAPLGEASNPTVKNNTFEQNQVGIQVYSDQATDNGEPIGHYEYNTVRANIIGVQVYSAGWTDPNDAEHILHPNFTYNNVFSNWGDAVNNLRGITIVVPGVGTVSVADSAGEFDNNYYSDDSLFMSSHDTNTNPRSSEVATSAPALPATPMVISTDTTWDATHAAPAITGPVFATAKLTVKGITLSSAYTIGAKKGGNLVFDNVTMDNANGVVLRNDNDVASTNTLRGTKLFDSITIFRTNATAKGNTLVGGGRDRGTAIAVLAGQFADDFVWTPTVNGNTASNFRYGMNALTSTVAFSGNTFKQMGIPRLNYFLALNLLQGGIVGVIATINADHNTFEDTGSAFWMNVGTINSNTDVIDGGFAGYNTAELSTLSFQNDVFANLEFGMVNALETSNSVSGSNITYNGIGAWSILNAVTFSNSNFYNNYLTAMYPYTTTLSGVKNTQAWTCTSCWMPTDETYLQEQGSSVTVTAPVPNAPNNVPKPTWAANAVDVTSGTRTLTAGTLNAPVIARQGGEVKATDIALDAAGRFPVGAKGGAASTGKLTMSGVTLTNPGFIALNSSSSTVKNNRISGFLGDGDLFLSAWNSPTFECNNVNLDGGYAGRVISTPSGNAPQFRRNMFKNSGDLDVAFAGVFGDSFHNASIVFENNSLVDGTSSYGMLFSTMNGTATVDGNNFLNTFSSARVAVLRSSTNGTADFPEVPGVMDARNNYAGNAAGDTTGPRVTFGAGITKNAGNGLRIHQGPTAKPWPNPLFSPWRDTAHAFAPCIGWTFTPSSPTELNTLGFDSSLTFDPSGFAIASYSWDFNGEGSSTSANPTFRFADGGSKSVTLTITTQGGKTTSLSKTISVAHVAPVADFAASIVNEVNPVTFTDASTHPNPADAPPSGWAYSWNFNNGEGTSTARNPSFQFADGGSKTVRLTVTDNDGQSNTVTKTITVPHVAPVANFGWTGSAETDTFQFSDTSTDPNPNDHVTAWAWSCNDGFTSTAQNPTHKFPDGGSFNCSLKVTDDDNQQNTVTKSVAVGNVAPNPDFSASFTNEASPVSFTDQSTHPNPNDAPPAGWAYAWDFHGEGSSSARNPSFQFGNGGALSVKLTVTDNDGKSSTVTRTVNLPQVAPVAAFTFSPAVPNPGDTVQFTDGTSHPNAPRDGVVSWSWDFNDGSPLDTSQNPTHVFANQGAYQVQLTVTDGDGLTSSVTVRIPVGNVPPVAAFTFSPANPTDLDTVSFDSSGSNDPDGSIVSYAWSFSDGFTSTAQGPQHRFADNGDYTATLTVTDNLGGVTSLTQTVHVLNVGPSAAFTVQPANPQVNDPVQFYDGSSDPDGNVASWSWTFGDGASSAATNPAHTYAAGGDYTVTLTVTDNDGAVSSVSQNVHVCETHVSLDLAHPQIEVCTKVHIPL